MHGEWSQVRPVSGPVTAADCGVVPRHRLHQSSSIFTYSPPSHTHSHTNSQHQSVKSANSVTTVIQWFIQVTVTEISRIFQEKFIVDWTVCTLLVTSEASVEAGAVIRDTDTIISSTQCRVKPADDDRQGTRIPGTIQHVQEQVWRSSLWWSGEREVRSQSYKLSTTVVRTFCKIGIIPFCCSLMHEGGEGVDRSLMKLNSRHCDCLTEPDSVVENWTKILFLRLALYVYEYLLHVGAQKAAQTFLNEIRWEKNITLGEPPGFLHSWWWWVNCAGNDQLILIYFHLQCVLGFVLRSTWEKRDLWPQQWS